MADDTLGRILLCLLYGPLESGRNGIKYTYKLNIIFFFPSLIGAKFFCLEVHHLDGSHSKWLL